MNIISIKNLKKYYGKSLGVENVDLELEEGEILGFIGPNGAGKSTTIRVLLGLLKPTSGECFLLGENCYTDGYKVRSQVGYMPSEIAVYEKMKVLDFLRFSAKLNNKSTEKLDYYVKLFELNVNKRMKELSLGNKKKVLAIQAFLGNPKVLVLDEPTTGLDPIMQDRFFDVLKELNKQGVTILFSSHNLAEVQKICSRVAIIKEGKIIAVENVDKFRNREIKNIEISLKSGEIDFSKLEGVKNLKNSTLAYKFSYEGEIKKLLQLIKDKDISGLSISDVDLEETFKHFYN